ncbi:hypothetical protein CVT26_007997, partial [Gymnopilus dilepis]
MATSEFQFDWLPLDVHLEILAYLPPGDIISVRRVCRQLCRVTKCRPLWVNVLHQIMAKHAVTEASYPVRSMGRASLERLSRLYERFLGSIRNHKEKPILPVNTHTLSRRLTKSETDQLSICTSGVAVDMRLLAGGRFLLTLSVDSIDFPSSTLFTLWDLGLNLRMNPPIKALARLLERTNELQLWLFFADQEMAETLWAVSVQRLTTSLLILVHKVTLSPQPTIEYFATHEAPLSHYEMPCTVALIPGTRTVVLSGHSDGRSYLRVWDFMGNRAAHLKGPCSSGYEQTSIFPFDGGILYTFKSRILGYSIPQLQPCSPNQILEPHSPQLAALVPSTTPEGFYVEYNNSSTFFPPLHSPARLLLVDDSQLHILDVSATIDKPRISRKIVSITDHRIHAALGDDCMNVGDDNLCFLSVAYLGALASLLDVRMTPGSDGKIHLDFVQAELRPDLDSTIRLQAISPLLCRHCILTRDGRVHVCRRLRDATQRRSLWLHALREFMTLHSVNETSFPLASLSDRHLEHLTRMQDRFADLIRKNDKKCILPLTSRTITSHLTDREARQYGINTAGVIDDMYLLSGGRFLMTLSTAQHDFPNSTLYTLWDLGLNLRMDPPILPLARFLQQTSDLQLLLFFADTKVEGLLWAVSTQRLLNSTMILVHQVLAMGSQAKIDLFAKHEVPSSSSATQCGVALIPGTRSIAWAGHHNGRNYLRIWDFDQDSAAHLVGLECSGSETIFLFPYNDCIFYAFANQILIYNIPQLQPVSPNSAFHEHKPALTILAPLTSRD